MKKWLLLLLLLVAPQFAHSQATVQAMCEPRCQFFNTNGSPLSLGKIVTDVSGTSTPLNSYTDNSGQTVNQNPLTLDGAGFGDIWLLSGNVYRIIAQDQNGVQQYIRDGIVGIGTGGGSGSANWSALLPGTNSNSGTFIVSGNGWDFSLANLFKAPVAAGIAPSAPGSFGYDSSANKWQFFQNGSQIGFGLSSSACAANQFVNTPATATAAATCAQPSAANLSNGTTGSGAVMLGTNPTLNGTSITGTPASGNLGAIIANGTAAMTTAQILTTTCGTVVTVSASGVTTADSIEWAWSGQPPASAVTLLTINWFVTTNNVNFQYCNPGGASVTPAAATLNWRVVR